MELLILLVIFTVLSRLGIIDRIIKALSEYVAKSQEEGKGTTKAPPADPSATEPLRFPVPKLQRTQPPPDEFSRPVEIVFATEPPPVIVPATPVIRSSSSQPIGGVMPVATVEQERNPWSGRLGVNEVQAGLIFAEIIQPPLALRQPRRMR